MSLVSSTDGLHLERLQPPLVTAPCWPRLFLRYVSKEPNLAEVPQKQES